MLHIGIHQHHRIGIAMVEPGAERVFLAEVAAEVDDLDARIALMLRQKLGPGVVAAAVVDADQAPIRVDGLEDGRHPGDEQGGLPAFIVER